jgi:hypothetical protein
LLSTYKLPFYNKKKKSEKEEGELGGEEGRGPEERRRKQVRKASRYSTTSARTPAPKPTF